MADDPAEKLAALRRLDQFRKWISLDDQRRCLQCGKIITGRQIELVGDGRGGPLRARCPTENCEAIPLDWALPSDAHLFTGPADYGGLILQGVDLGNGTSDPVHKGDLGWDRIH
jgi:hypothetical protein